MKKKNVCKTSIYTTLKNKNIHINIHPILSHIQVNTKRNKQLQYIVKYFINMAHVAVINHPDHQHNFRTEQEEHEIQEHLKEVAEEAREEEGDVNPNDVHPILWQIYNIASIAQPILFVFYLLLMSLIIRRLVIDPGTFAFNDVLTNALIEENWDAEWRRKINYKM